MPNFWADSDDDDGEGGDITNAPANDPYWATFGKCTQEFDRRRRLGMSAVSPESGESVADYQGRNTQRASTGANYMARGIGRAKSEPGYDVGEVEVLRVSDKAAQVRWGGGPDSDLHEEWFPFSQIHNSSVLTEDNCKVGEKYNLVVSTWIAEQKELESGDGFD